MSILELIKSPLGVWGLFINLLSGILFAYDKHAAIKNRRRISEQTLHILEILGGVVATIVLMYTLRHKNQKFSYWVWTWVVMIGWVVINSLLYSHFIV